MRHGLTLTAFDTDDLIDKSHRKLFRQATQPSFPPKTSTYSSYQLRKRQHPYLLPTVQYSQFKNSYINRCLSKYVHNPLIIILCSFYQFILHVLCFVFYIFCILCISMLFHLVTVCYCHTE